jgi:hypothetical protein
MQRHHRRVIANTLPILAGIAGLPSPDILTTLAQKFGITLPMQQQVANPSMPAVTQVTTATAAK